MKGRWLTRPTVAIIWGLIWGVLSYQSSSWDPGVLIKAVFYLVWQTTFMNCSFCWSSGPWTFGRGPCPLVLRRTVYNQIVSLEQPDKTGYSNIFTPPGRICLRVRVRICEGRGGDARARALGGGGGYDVWHCRAACRDTSRSCLRRDKEVNSALTRNGKHALSLLFCSVRWFLLKGSSERTQAGFNALKRKFLHTRECFCTVTDTDTSLRLLDHRFVENTPMLVLPARV